LSLEDRFEISAPIHIGQIATAYPAREKSSSLKVLLKIIHPQFAGDAELVKRFEREGQAMSKIDHPNVVKVYEQGNEGNIPYLVLEWVEGGTLYDKIKNGPLDQGKVRELSKDILSGLEAVHKIGLIHRDLKPDNILIYQNGSAKLGDFSLSGFVNPSGLTEHNAMIGTPAYFAPELTEGSPATVASDLYGVGMILFESLTGSNPFSDVDPIIALGMIHKTTLPKLSEKTGIENRLAELVDMLLCSDSSDRPESAAVALNYLSGVRRKSHSKIIGQNVVAWATFVAIISGFIFWLNSFKADLVSWRPPIVDLHNVVRSIDSALIPDIKDSTTMNLSTNINLIRKGGSSSSGSPLVTQVHVKNIVPNLPARLTIIVLPWATVFQDGEELGMTPLGTRSVTVGEHQFKFINKDYPPYERSYAAISGGNDTLLIDLKEQSVRLDISAKPWGYLWVDMDSIGILPRADPIWVAEGNHSLRIHHPVLGEWQDSIIVNRGSRHNYSVDMTKQLLDTDLSAD